MRTFEQGFGRWLEEVLKGNAQIPKVIHQIWIGPKVRSGHLGTCWMGVIGCVCSLHLWWWWTNFTSFLSWQGWYCGWTGWTLGLYELYDLRGHQKYEAGGDIVQVWVAPRVVRHSNTRDENFSILVGLCRDFLWAERIFCQEPPCLWIDTFRVEYLAANPGWGFHLWSDEEAGCITGWSLTRIRRTWTPRLKNGSSDCPMWYLSFLTIYTFIYILQMTKACWLGALTQKAFEQNRTRRMVTFASSRLCG